MLKNRAVFLDRDGVINQALVRDGKPCSPASLAELEILPGVAEALARLQAAGFRLIVVTNQPEVARGSLTEQAVEELHAALRAHLPLSEFRVCFHDSADGCSCRKPAPGLLLAAARDHELDLPASFLVGDRWKDVAAAQRAGCVALFVDHRYHEDRPKPPYVAVASLAEAADWILEHTDGVTR